MKRKNRVLKICACVLMTLLALMGNRAYAADTQGLSVDVVCGYNGVAKYGESIPVTVEIKNEGEAFGGVVNLYAGASIAYASDVVIGAGETKSVSFYLSEISNHSQMHITIYDDGGKAVYSQESIVRVDSPSTAFVGILSDDYGALSYFSNLMIRDQTNSMSLPAVVNLAKSPHSPDHNSLDMFDVIVLNDFHTGGLTQGQSEQLKAWVGQGGTLLIGTGVHYQKTISGFVNDYLGGTVGLIESRTGYLGMRDDLDVVGESGGLSLDVLDIRLTSGSASGDRWYQLVKRGLGNVAVFQFDLADSSLINWQYRDRSMEAIVNDILLNKAGRQDFYKFEDNSVSDIISNVYINDIPNIGRYIAALSVYIVLLPVIYLTLKRKDKRHLIWIAVPVLSVLFGVIIYVTGSGSRLKNPNLNYLCVLTPNGYGAQETVYMGSTSPRNREYRFSVNSGYDLAAIHDYRYGYYGPRVMSGYGDARVTIKRGAAANDISIRYNSAFQTSYFSAEKYNDSIGDLRVQVDYLQDGWHLTVANHTGLELEDAGIIIPEYGVIRIGSLGDGETAEFDESHIQLGSGYTYGYDAASIIIPDTSENERRISRQNQISVYCRYAYRRYEPYFIGFTSGYAPDIGDNPDIDTAGDTMLVRSAGLASEGNGMFIPNIEGYLVTYDGNYGYLYDPEPLYVTYQFSDAEIGSFRLRNAEDRGMVSFLNVETGEFDMVFPDDGILSDGIESYLDDNRILKVKYELDPNRGEAPIPVISAFGAPAANG